MIPNCFLIFTEPLSGLGRIILILAPLGVYLIVFSLLKKAGLIQLILIPLLIFHAFQMVLFYLFGESVIAVDMFLIYQRQSLRSRRAAKQFVAGYNPGLCPLYSDHRSRFYVGTL